MESHHPTTSKSSHAPYVRQVNADELPSIRDELVEILRDCVAGNASVGFMHPCTHEKAVEFWSSIETEVHRGHRVLFVAGRTPAHIDGTVQLAFPTYENQPHRADVVKLLVHRRARRVGLGELLLRHLETVALEEKRTLLVLDTAADDALRLYLRLGWVSVGRVPNYALLPNGEPCDTTFAYRDLSVGEDTAALSRTPNR